MCCVKVIENCYCNIVSTKKYQNVLRKRTKHYLLRNINLVVKNVTKSYWSRLCFHLLGTEICAEIFLLLSDQGLNCETLRTEDSKDIMCVLSYLSGSKFNVITDIVEKVCNVKKLYGSSCSQCKCSYHRTF
jgi:hypothetical protein